MTGIIQGVWGDDGGGIPGESSNESTWNSGGDATELENPGRGVWATNFPYGIPSKGRLAELPSGGMPRPNGDEDSNAGALLAPACP